MYILTTRENHKLMITKKERDGIIEAMNDNQKAITVKDCLIPLAIPPEILPFETWYIQENDRLANFKKRLCKKCLSVMPVDCGCTCWKRNKEEDANPLAIPESIRKQLQVRSMPEVSELDIATEEAMMDVKLLK